MSSIFIKMENETNIFRNSNGKKIIVDKLISLCYNKFIKQNRKEK